MPNPPIPPLSPYLVCKDAAKAMDFYIAALGAAELTRLLGPDGKLFHGALSLDGGLVMLSEENPKWGALSPLTLKGTPVTLHLAVPDCDAAMKRAADAGATVAMPAADMFWGDRYGQIVDPFGHRWSFGQKLRDVSPGEMQAAATKMFEQAAGCDPDAAKGG